MRKLLWGIAAIVGIAVAAAFLFWPRDPVVDTITVARGDAVRSLAVNGTIRPRLSVEVQAPVAGTLTALPLDVGDQVNVGQLLARVDDAPQRAAIAEAQASVATQETVLAQARRDYARYAALGEFVTRQRREEARLAVDQGLEELKRRRALVTQAREVQDRYTIRAPFAGVILERPVDPGQTISASTVLYRLADLNDPEIGAEVDELYAAALRVGGEAVVTLAGQSDSIAASIVHVAPRVDPASGAREVRLRATKPLTGIASGVTVAVNLIVARESDAISIPRSAILNPDSKPQVRVIGSDGVVQARDISFVDWPADRVTVRSGLAVGDRILVDPKAAEVGRRVRPRN